MEKRVETTLRFDPDLLHNLRVAATVLGFRSFNAFANYYLEKLLVHLRETNGDVKKHTEARTK